MLNYTKKKKKILNHLKQGNFKRKDSGCDVQYNTEVLFQCSWYMEKSVVLQNYFNFAANLKNK